MNKYLTMGMGGLVLIVYGMFLNDALFGSYFGMVLWGILTALNTAYFLHFVEEPTLDPKTALGIAGAVALVTGGSAKGTTLALGWNSWNDLVSTAGWWVSAMHISIVALTLTGVLFTILGFSLWNGFGQERVRVIAA